MKTSMKKKTGITGMLLFLGMTIIFQLVYYMWIRDMISNVGVFYSHLDGGPSGTSPREVTDHFVCCVGFIHYFLFGYLYSVKRHYAENSHNGKNGKVKFWVGLEIFCQLGIFLSYLLLWIDNHILYYIDNTYWHWSVGGSTTTLFRYFCKKEMISDEYLWAEQYGDVFDLTVIIAPVFLMFLIYSIHFVFRLIQFKRHNRLHVIWAIWTVGFLLAIVLLAVRNFQQMGLADWWHWYNENILP